MQVETTSKGVQTVAEKEPIRSSLAGRGRETEKRILGIQKVGAILRSLCVLAPESPLLAKCYLRSLLLQHSVG